VKAHLVMLLFVAGAAHAQQCPPVDAQAQKAGERECRAAGGEWGRFGVHAQLCGIYTCVERTRDGGKPCRSTSDCEHRCVTEAPPRIGAEAAGKCTANRSSFGCFTYLDGGKIVGRVCAD
jgi:hypothetical protein